MLVLGQENTALDKAIEKAYNHFKETRDRKIIIFSNCKADISTIPIVCARADKYIYNNDKFSLGNIVMVNNANNFDIDDTDTMLNMTLQIECLINNWV